MKSKDTILLENAYKKVLKESEGRSFDSAQYNNYEEEPTEKIRDIEHWNSLYNNMMENPSPERIESFYKMYNKVVKDYFNAAKAGKTPKVEEFEDHIMDLGSKIVGQKWIQEFLAQKNLPK